MTLSPRIREGDVLRSPTQDDLRHSTLASFADRVVAQGLVALERLDPASDYEALRLWSLAEPEQFWSNVAEFFEIPSSGDWGLPRYRGDLSGAGWFPGVRLNYAEAVFARQTDAHPAVVISDETGAVDEVSWRELRGAVATLAHHLRSVGVAEGTRVVAYLPNGLEAFVGLLATASLGAIWSCCSPDYGAESVVDRLAQLEPVALLGTEAYRYGGKVVDRSSDLGAIIRALPTLRSVVLADSPLVSGNQSGAATWSSLPTAAPDDLTFNRVAFDAPLWVLYSSGTTGLPKGITHGHGGVVLEHAKLLGLQDDVRAGDRFFWHTSSSWMVWNVTVSAALVGGVPVLHDGAATFPGTAELWEVVGRTGATHFGTSPGYLNACEREEIAPAEVADLSRLRSIISSGAPLPLHSWGWVYDVLGSDIWLDASSGGTDVASAFIAGCPFLPVRAGQTQSRALGVAVESWGGAGEPLVDATGELVVTAPLPSMPLYFWNDPDGSRYRESYFEVFPGVWRHGDWITITSHGTAVVHGRSDSLINRHGVRIGSADIYAAVERIPEVTDCLVVGVELGDADYWMPLFITLAETADRDLVQAEIVAKLRAQCSPRHVPDEILLAPAIPRTLTGKRVEVPIKRLLQGRPLAEVVKASSIDRPEVLPWFAALARQPLSPTTRKRDK